jgi:hypothetical protein
MPERLCIWFSDEAIDAIDEWRRTQRDLPSRTAAIRRMLALALKRPTLADAPTRREYVTPKRQKR